MSVHSGAPSEAPPPRVPLLLTPGGKAAAAVVGAGLVVSSLVLLRPAVKRIRALLGGRKEDPVPNARPRRPEHEIGEEEDLDDDDLDEDGPPPPAPASQAPAPKAPAPHAPTPPGPAPQAPQGASPGAAPSEIQNEVLVQSLNALQRMDAFLRENGPVIEPGLSQPLPDADAPTATLTLYMVVGCPMCRTTYAAWQQAVVSLEHKASGVLLRTAYNGGDPLQPANTAAIEEGEAAGVRTAPAIVARVGQRVLFTLQPKEGERITTADILDAAHRVVQAPQGEAATPGDDGTASAAEDSPTAPSAAEAPEAPLVA